MGHGILREEMIRIESGRCLPVFQQIPSVPLGQAPRWTGGAFLPILVLTTDEKATIVFCVIPNVVITTYPFIPFFTPGQ